MLYTKAAAARILNVKPYQIRFIQEFDKVVNVCVDGKKPVFVSKKAFKTDFSDFRKNSAKQITGITQVTDTLYCVPGKTETYTVQLTKDRVICDCQDYVNQTQFFTHKQMCKHGYAVLSLYGYNSLTNWIKQTHL